MRYCVRFLAFSITILFQIVVKAQSQTFVPLKFEYPDSILKTPKTYVYKNVSSGALRYRDIVFQRKQNNIIINWKEYDQSHLADSSTEINGKSADHYMIINGEAIKAVVTEDSIYRNGTTLGERVQTRFFNLSSTISLFESMRSVFLKDTSITWHNNPVPCLVIQCFYIQKLANSLFPNTSKEITGVVYYYFGKDVGLLMYRSEMDNETQTWQLFDIKERKIR